MTSDEFTEQLDEGLLSKIGTRIKKAFTMDDAEYILGRITDAILTVQHNLMTNYYQQSMHWMNLENWAQETKDEDIIDLVEDLHLIFNHWTTEPDITLVRETLKSLQLLQTKAEQYFKNNTTQSTTNEDEQLDENLRRWFKEKWVRFGPDGKIRGACARGDDSEGKPKCLPQKKAQNLGKKGRKYAASKKRREDPNPERTGKAKNVATKKKTNEDIPFNECPSCRGPIVHESMMNEKQDACYHKVKSRYKVWPSAYASGALVQCRKKGASNWGTGGKKSESSIMKGIIDEASGTPGGLERYRTPAMVNTTMQQNLYKRELAPIKAAEKKRKEAEYRKNNPSVSVPSIQIGASNYPINVIHNWIGSRDLNAAVEFAVNKFAYRQSKDFKTEIAGDPDFQKAVKNFFNVAEKSLNHRDSTRTKSHWDGKIRAAPRETDTSSDGFDAINKINDALLPYYKKYGVDKTGRRVPPNFNYALGEAKAKQYVKPYNDPQTGEQIGWVSSDGYHKKYWQKFAKNSAIKHAKLNPDEVDEDYTGEFAAEKTPKINPYGGLKDNQFRGAISETPTDNPTGASGEGGWRKYKPKSAGTFKEAAGQKYEVRFANGKTQRFVAVSPEEAKKKAKGLGASSLIKINKDGMPKGKVEEEQLDEKCWDSHKQVGMKNKGGRQVPNCVPKESAIMKGLKSL